MRECEKMLKFVQSRRDSLLELVGGSQLASCQMMHTSEACKEDEQSCQLEHYRTKKSNLAILFARSLNSRLSQVARLSHQPTLS